MKIKIIVFTVLVFFVFAGCGRKQYDHYVKEGIEPLSHVVYAGARSSNYGVRPFPKAVEWEHIMDTMSGFYPGSTPAAVWILGPLHQETHCRLEFPGDAEKVPYTAYLDYDKHEPYLAAFDERGIKVFLQVESGLAPISSLIDLVLERYKHHRSVIGFGVDVEWYGDADERGWGVPVADDSASVWEERVKAHNPDYRLFLKHWDRNWMPPEYRGDIIFITDAQYIRDFQHMMENYTEYWADYFYPNHVGYQIGYRTDHTWWNKLENPPKDIGTAVIHHIRQPCSIFWVDFTLKLAGLLEEN